ncbi:ATP-dependent DNA helicase srs2 [Purpureocillium lavendulum]|uniref:ATP-dependent DNA helicase srs2 n=1 Tax=Purpureocillium lavendulum TaxID=1247861 RepID=A0AB34FS89_9HYPO|nr:ATP-dependent DNA helicase srs2 [Purpureocillium lavendulum]
MVQRNHVIAIIIIVLFAILALVSFGIWKLVHTARRDLSVTSASSGSIRMSEYRDVGRGAQPERYVVSVPSPAGSLDEPPPDLLYEVAADDDDDATPRAPPLQYEYICGFPTLKPLLQRLEPSEPAAQRRGGYAKDRDATSDMVSSSYAAGPSASHKQSLVALKLLHELKADLESRRRDKTRQRDEYSTAVRRREWLDFRREPLPFLTAALGIDEPQDLLDRMRCFFEAGGPPHDPCEDAALMAELGWGMEDLTREDMLRWMARSLHEVGVLKRQVEAVDSLIMHASRALVEGEDDEEEEEEEEEEEDGRLDPGLSCWKRDEEERPATTDRGRTMVHDLKMPSLDKGKGVDTGGARTDVVERLLLNRLDLGSTGVNLSRTSNLEMGSADHDRDDAAVNIAGPGASNCATAAQGPDAILRGMSRDEVLEALHRVMLQNAVLAESLRAAGFVSRPSGETR